MKVAIVGLGLIGGSMALTLKRLGIAKKIYGVDANEAHCSKALQLNIADEILPLGQAIKNSDLIVLAIPVNAVKAVLPTVLNLVDKQVVMDVGSTKEIVCSIAAMHKKGKRFVATHPMWGTEFSGPEAAVDNAFAGKAAVVCNKESSDVDAVNLVEQLYLKLGMHIIFMDARAHDVHAAYVSHVSHITSFALANTVLEKEKEDDAIFELASAGFESTVRLAKSNAAMWVPIFLENKVNVLDVLNEHINQLNKFKQSIEQENAQELQTLIQQANEVKRILK